VRADVETEMLSRRLEPAFPTIVASGKNISEPHHIPSGSKAKEPLLIDMGLRFNGYCSDVTRTYGSRYERQLRSVFDAIEPMLVSGAKAADIDKIARKALGKDAAFFNTSLGHGLGISVHESPVLSPKSKDILEEGNVITLEPGIYVPGGIRTENVYVIKKNGAENLTPL
jgi:Xaa-Pro aminopeptidase